MQQSEILSFTEKLIPVYQSPDFELILSQLTDGQSASSKLLIKMELNRLMSPCKKSIDLRSRLETECREFEIDGINHWFDDIALNDFQKNVKKFSGYTEGVWEIVYKNRLEQKEKQKSDSTAGNATKAFLAEPIKLGYDLKRQENRLSLSSQVLLTVGNQTIHGVSVDLSPSGAKFKVPSAFRYKLGQSFQVHFTELSKKSKLPGLEQSIEYRILAIDDGYENNAIKYLRTQRVTETQLINQLIAELLASNLKKNRHNNQDNLIRTRTRGFEHIYLKHTVSLPLFFSGNQLKLALLTSYNRSLWQYWHDERNQQSLGSLFNHDHLGQLTQQGINSFSDTLYSFKHDYQDKQLFFAMLQSQATEQQKQLFWHMGAKKDSWKVFRLSMFTLSADEQVILASYDQELSDQSAQLTHCIILQEIADMDSAADYLMGTKSSLATNELNPFRLSRQIIGQPIAIYFDSGSQRKEQRYRFRTPLQLKQQQTTLAEGVSVDLSKHGVSIILNQALALKAGDKVQVNFSDLKRYDPKLPLDALPYEVVRIGPEGRRLQLKIEETSATIKSIAFFNALITHNQDKLLTQKEQLPSPQLLEGLHNILMDKLLSTPVYIKKRAANLQPHAIGTCYPLPNFLGLLARLGQDGYFSLEPIFKGHTNSLLASPMRRIDGAEAQWHEIYIAVVQYGERIQSVEVRLRHEFENHKQRLQFMQGAQEMGNIYVLRIASAPIFDSMTTLMRSDLNELLLTCLNDANVLEKELTNIVGYCELIDITQETLLRLELTV